MKIGFDVDNVIVDNTQVIPKYFEKFSKAKGYQYFERSYLNLPPEDKQEFFDAYLLTIFKETPLFDGVKEVFDYLNKKGHEIYIITRRGYEEDMACTDVTIDYLKKHNLNYKEIHFCVTEKGKLCKKLGVNLLFDDRDYNLYDCKKHGIKGVKFGREKMPEFDHVNNWKEILKYIKKEGY